VFIIGIKKDTNAQFEWPEKKEMKNINEYVDQGDTQRNSVTIRQNKFIENILKKVQNPIFIDVGFLGLTMFPNSHLYSPSLNTKPDLWCVPCHRKANIKEILSLQGFPVDFKQVVSKTQLKKQIGNSMSVNVLEEIFKKLLL
jgi:site-specific DNA-cytosine methylase